MQEIENKPERALLVAVDTGEYDTQASLAELYELTRSAGAEPAGSVVQKRPRVEAGTCVGTGMLQEIGDFCQKEEIDLLIFDRELSPTQIRNIEEATDVRVIDRTQLILDIFAQRARSREGRLQVELAQLRYLLPRLTGRGATMSRLGGGIGPGGRAKANWKPTAVIFAAGLKDYGNSWKKWKSTAICCKIAAAKTVRLPWRWWDIPTRAKAR